MSLTESKYKEIIASCRSIYEKKLRDYGPSWRILRLASLTDQIFIKARRIRTIQEHADPRISDSQESEFIGIINYSIIALIQIELGVFELGDEIGNLDLKFSDALKHYDKQVDKSFQLMQDKNHDYGEAWKEMRLAGLTDLIIQKLFRIKNIDSNQGKTLVSEGVESNYTDIINYSVFALIHLGNQ